MAKALGKLAGAVLHLGRARPGLALAGGTVRDALLGRPCKDIDITVEKGSPVRAGKAFADAAGGALVILGKERLVRVHLSGATVDFTPLRAGNLEADLGMRDFTVNAMAVRIPWGRAADVIDPLGGRGDLARGIIRMCGARAFREDPVRLWRAHRLAAALGFRTDRATARRIRADARRAGDCSPERLRDELFRLLCLRRSAKPLREALRSGVLLATFPELAPMRRVPAHRRGSLDVLEHTLEALEHLERVLERLPRHLGKEAAEAETHLASCLVPGRSRVALLKLAVLLHDVAKPETVSTESGGTVHFYEHERKGAARAAELMRTRLRTSRAEEEAVARVVMCHLRIGHLAAAPSYSGKAVYRFLKAAGPELFEILLVSIADRMATHHRRAAAMPRVRETIGRILRQRRLVRARTPAKRILTGHDVMKALGIEPGPAVGTALRAVEEAVALGRVKTRGEALKIARRALDRRSS